MHSYRPQKENRAHIIIPILLLLMCFTCTWASKTAPIIPPYIMQFLAIASAAVAIQIITRYSLSSFVYETDPESNSFKVTKQTGKKSTLVADIEYTDILHIDEKKKGYSVKKKYSKSYKIYNFCNNIYPHNAYCIVCNISGDDIAVNIEADAAFLEIINSAVSRHNTDNDDIFKENKQ